MRKTINKVVPLFFSAVFFLFFSGMVYAGSQQETLSQYISDLQKNPDDNAQRAKIIKLAQEMKPAPAVPAEAEKFNDRGEYAAKTAKSEADFADAAKEYEKALLIAPWIAEDYCNLGILQEKSNQPQKAIESLNLYLLAAPNAKDAREVRKRIAGLEYAAEKSAKQSNFEAAGWIKDLDGRRYTLSLGYGQTGVMDIKGKVIVAGNIMPDGGYSEIFRIEVAGRQSPMPIDSNSPAARLGLIESTLIISEDGNKIIERSRYKNGDVHEQVYLWQK